MRYLLIFVLALSWCMVSRAQDLSSSIQTGAFWLQEARGISLGRYVLQLR